MQHDELLRLQASGQQIEASMQEEKRLNLQKEKNLSVQQKATNEYIASIRQYESEKKLKNEQLKFRQRSEEHTSELQSLMRISYAVLCLKKKNKRNIHTTIYNKK